MTADLKAMAKDVAQHRDEIIERMVNFSLTDTLLFGDARRTELSVDSSSMEIEDLIAEERQVWDPIVEWAKKNMDADFKTSESLEVPMENNASLPRLQVFLEKLSDKELAAFYQTGKITKSVLLAAALVKKQITADEAFRAAFLEEIWQADKWGHDAEADQRREVIRQELIDVEKFLAE